MALSFIPNQPILFEDPIFSGQTCLNNDVRAYAQLAQPGDVTCVQWKNEPLGNISDCAMNEQPNVITNGNFDSLLTGWQQINLGSGAITAPTIWSYNGTGAVTTGGPLALFTSTGITVGNLTMLSFYVSDPTIQISVGVGDSATNSWNNLASAQINYDGRAVVIFYAAAGSEIYIAGNGPVEIRDVIVRDINLTYCFTPNTDSLYWSYVESLNGYQLISSSGTPRPLTLRNSFSSGTTYRISFKVKELSVNPLNYVYIADGTTNDIIVSADDNKEYTFWYTHTNATTQVTLNVSDWTNLDLLGVIIYDVNIEYFNFSYTTSIVFPNGDCASTDYNSSSVTNPITFYQDRIIWCFDWSLISSCGTGDPLFSDCYKIKITDNETGLSATSYTTINFKNEGHDCSVMMVGDNTGYAFNFFFNDPSSEVAFTLRQRLRLLQFNPSYPAKSEEYLYSNGNHVRTYAESAKFRTAWFDYVDEPTHDVIRLQLLSDTLTLDGVEFFCAAEDYEPEWSANGKYNLAQSRVVMKAVQEKSLFNKSC